MTGNVSGNLTENLAGREHFDWGLAVYLTVYLSGGRVTSVIQSVHQYGFSDVSACGGYERGGDESVRRWGKGVMKV